MSGTTSVPPIAITSTGVVAPLESAVLAGVQADINAAFGGGLNPGLTTPQGQLASSESAIIGDVNSQFLFLANMFDPAFAEGRFQDGLARQYFITRNPAQPTVVSSVACSGGTGVVIPTGAQIEAADGNIYLCTAGGTIPSSGSINLPFACATTGPIACPAQTFSIYQTIPGWDSAVSSAAGVLGNVVESRAAFEQRRQNTIALNGVGSLPSILANVLNVPNVLDAYVTDNSTASPVTVGGVTLPAYVLYVCVSGGDPLAVATAIWQKKMPGGPYYAGGTTETVYDPNPLYITPPAYSVTFQTAVATPVYMVITLKNSAAVPSNVLTLVQAAVMSAFAGADGGSRARIGTTVFASRYYAGIAALGAWAQIISITIGAGTQGSFTSGTISATTLSVITGGTGIAVNQLIFTTPGGSAVLPGTIITALGSGTGGNGTYTVNLSQTASSAFGANLTTLGNSAALNINQVPTIQASNIQLTLV